MVQFLPVESYMKRLLTTLLISVFAMPAVGAADRFSLGNRIGVQLKVAPALRDRHRQASWQSQKHPSNRLRRHRFPSRLPYHPKHPVKPVHPICPGKKPDKPGYHRPIYWWPTTRTVVRETETIIIVSPPPPAESPAPSEPQKEWVPPVMDTRTEPGYWDYGVKKKWMGDHWRYEQDVENKIWVPASQVTYVKQAGYWKVVK